MFSGGRLVDVLSVDVLPMPLCLNVGTSCCRRPLLRRYVAAVGCNLGPGPATCVGTGNPKRHWAIPREAERRSGRASATKRGPFRIVQFLWLWVLWLGKSAHQTGAVSNPARSESVRDEGETIFIARKHYFMTFLSLRLGAFVLLPKLGARPF